MRVAILCAAALLAVATAPQVWPTLGRYTDATSATATFAADVLDPPTGLTATAEAGVTAVLSWTATVDSHATGYRVYRSPTPGGGYTLVATVTPRTVTSTTDMPVLPGTYYFVLRSYVGSWTSAASNEVSVLLL